MNPSPALLQFHGNLAHCSSTHLFDYASFLPPLSLPRERSLSVDFSFTMSTSIDDTFSFIRRQPLRRRVDSDASSFYFCPSFTHPYNPYSRNHRRSIDECSVDSELSDISGTNLGRPGLGHRMLDSVLEHGTSLVSISASPSPSLVRSVRGEGIRSEKYESRSSYDSVMDSQYESQRTNSLLRKPAIGTRSVCRTRIRRSLCRTQATAPRSLLVVARYLV